MSIETSATQPICGQCGGTIEENSYTYIDGVACHIGCMSLGYKYNNPQKQLGWICPNCGRGVSPFIAECSCYQLWGSY